MSPSRPQPQRDRLGHDVRDVARPIEAVRTRGISEDTGEVGVTICVAVVSRNDASLLDDCLRSAKDANELIVLDMRSSDDTREIAERHGARVEVVAEAPIAERVRQRAHEVSACDWVLHLDPDERLPPTWLQAAATEIAHDAGRFTGYLLQYLDYAIGRPLHHLSRSAGKVALVSREGTAWNSCAHAHTTPQLSGNAGSLVGRVAPIHHFTLRSIEQATEKISRYASSGGSAAMRAPDDPWSLVKMLYHHIVVREAWRDGPSGILFVSLDAISDYLALQAAALRDGVPMKPVRPSTTRVLRLLAALQRVRTRLSRVPARP